MGEIGNPHDKFFKETFTHPEAVQDFLLNYLPAEVRAVLNLSTLTPAKDSLIDCSLQEQFTDLLFAVQAKTRQEIYIYLLFEHKSFPEPLIAFHLLRYMVRIWEQDLRKEGCSVLRPILPLVVYHGQPVWTPSREFAALLPDEPALRPYIPRFQYLLYDLPRMADDEIVGRELLRTAFLLLKYIHSRDLRMHLKSVFQLMEERGRTKSIQDWFETVIVYLLNGTDQITYEELVLEVENTLSPKGGLAMPTIAEQLIAKGRQEGWQVGLHEGKQEGRQEGEAQGQRKAQRESILHILETRFGSVPPHAKDSLDLIEDSSALRNLLTLAVTVSSVDEFAKQLLS